MFCRNCGKPCGDTDVFCMYCGTKLDLSAEMAAPAETSAAIEAPAPVETPAPTNAPAPELVLPPQVPDDAPLPDQAGPELVAGLPMPGEPEAPAGPPTPMPMPDPFGAPAVEAPAADAGPAPAAAQTPPPPPMPDPLGAGQPPRAPEPPRYAPPTPPPPPQAGQPPAYTPPAGGRSGQDTAILCGFIAVAVFSGFMALRGVLGGLRGLFRVNLFFSLSSLFSLVGGAAFAGIAFLLVLAALRRTPDTTGPLVAGMLACAALGVVTVVVSFLSSLLGLIVYYGDFAALGFLFNIPSLGGILGNAIFYVLAAGIPIGLLYAVGQAPLRGKGFDAIKADLAHLPKVIPALLHREPVPAGAAGPAPSGPAYQQQAPAGGAAAAAAAAAAASAGAAYAAAQQAGPEPNQGPLYQTMAYAGPLPTDRSLLVYILLSLVTCGIYHYYFIYKLAKDTNIVCAGDGKDTPGLVVYLLLSLVTCGIYSFIWYYGLGNRYAANAPRYGFAFQENGTTVLMWMLFGSLLCGIGAFVALHILIKNLNALCAAYNQSIRT